MSKYRNKLPLREKEMFLSDGGMETTLVFHEGIDLPYFAAFDLLKDDHGTEVLRRYYNHYARMAVERGMSFVLEAPTWRANADWGERLGYDSDTLADANRKGVGLMLEIRDQFESATSKFIVSGNIGPRGDGYSVTERMSVTQAEHYHLPQIRTFARSDADMVSAFTLNYVEEAIGIVLAARSQNIPVVISFTLETDGRLPSGDSLADAIQRTDEASDGYPVYYMINCAHPTHFAHILQQTEPWQLRIGGLRANASTRSHAELDECTELDDGDPLDLGQQYREMTQCFPNLVVVGGCCGTDHRHVEAICSAVSTNVELVTHRIAK